MPQPDQKKPPSLARALVETRIRARRASRLALPHVLDDAFWSVWREADWVPGAEHLLWEEVHGGPVAHPRRRVPRRLARLLLALEADAVGWAAVPRGEDYPQFVARGSWTARHRAWANRCVFGGLPRTPPPEQRKPRQKRPRRRGPQK